MNQPSTARTSDERRRARARRLDRVRTRGLSTARKACLACPVMALLWVLGLWYEIPTWVVAVILLVVLPGVLLLSRGMMRGRTVRMSSEPGTE